MRLLIHDTLVTSPLLLPLTEGWVATEVSVVPKASVRAGDLQRDDVALIPSAEIASLSATHQVVPDVAVVATGEGAVALRVPVRPDEIERTPIRLYNASGTAEILARATIQQFYGIQPSEFTSDEAAGAQAVVVEGAEAVRPPEAGLSEDLCRAWFILTGQPVVTHLLVAPKAFDRAQISPVVDLLASVAAVAHERRRDLRRIVGERHGIDRDALTRIFAAQRLRLEDEDRRALLMLLQRGNRGSAYPYMWEIPYLEPPPS